MATNEIEACCKQRAVGLCHSPRLQYMHVYAIVYYYVYRYIHDMKMPEDNTTSWLQILAIYFEGHQSQFYAKTATEI